MRVGLVYLVIAVLAGPLCWWLVDLNVYLFDGWNFQTGLAEYKVLYKFSVAEQLVGSAVMGVSLAALLYAPVWFMRRSPPSRSFLEKFTIAIALGGAVMGLGSIYVGWRLGGDLWYHPEWMGVQGLLYNLAGCPLLIVSEAVAFLLWVIARIKQRGGEPS